MSLYQFRCPTHGDFDARLPMTDETVSREATPCPDCGDLARRVWTPPITDCASFGRNSFTTRTLPIHRKPQDELQEERIRDYRRRDYTHIQFGAGKTTGS